MNNPFELYKCERCGKEAIGIFKKQYLCTKCFDITKRKETIKWNKEARELKITKIEKHLYPEI